jgi:DNA polymerase I-like protein with 3'-5' exonuclease and polymerase domains
MTLLFPLTKVFVIDCETLGTEARWNPKLPVYFTGILLIDEENRMRKEKYWRVEEAIKRTQQLLDEGWVMIAHNAKYELSTFCTRGLKHTIEKDKLSVVCTMVNEYTRNSGLQSYSLDALTGLKSDVIADAQEKGLLGEGVTKKNFWQTDWSNNPAMLRHIGDYCCDDLKATWTLYQRQAAWYNREENAKFRQALYSLEFPLLSVLAHMEQHGMCVNVEALEKLTKDCLTEVEEHRRTLDATAGLLPVLKWDKETEDYYPFVKEFAKNPHKNVGNISYYLDNEGIVTSSVSNLVGAHCPLVPYNSAAATGHTYWLIKQQCPEVLEKAEQTPKGKPKLNKDFFADVASELPENLPIAKYLKATKNLQTCTSIAKHVYEGRIHGSFNNCLTRTGRLSSSEPNLQNIQRPDKDPTSVTSRFRQIFTARDKDHTILCADLDRIEIVVLAWFLLVAMKDSGLADVCNTPGADPHQANADRWKVARIIAKTLIFLLVYGGGAGLIYKRGMTKTLEEAEAMVKQVSDEQPSINKLKESVWARGRERGYITNPFNARGVYPELYSKRKWERGAGERKAFNFVIQRTARDIIHLLAVESFPVVLKHGACIASIVHDEMIIECPLESAEQLKQELQVIWGRRGDILKGVFVNGDWNAGDNWFEAKGA